MVYKKGVAIKVFYVALHRTTGLTTLDMKVYDEVGGLSTTITLTEIVGSGGGYYGSFTPDEKGQWRVRIQDTGSASNGDDIQKVFEVGNTDVDSLETKIDLIDSNVDLVKTETDKIQSIKTKTDNLPANTATELTDIKNMVQDIDDQVSTGGYIMN
jgi:hypothetical protein